MSPRKTQFICVDRYSFYSLNIIYNSLLRGFCVDWHLGWLLEFGYTVATPGGWRS